MKTVYFVILSIICLSACSDKKAEPAKYCENELELISNFEGPVQTNMRIEMVRQSPNQAVIPFLADSTCDQVQLNYQLPLGNKEQIDISFNILYSEDCELPPFTPRYFCHIYMGNTDTLLIEQELATINLVSKKVYEFYKNDGSIKRDLENYRHVYVSFLWGEDANSYTINKTIEHSIDGYLQFADSLSNTNFHKRICDLNKTELDSLHGIIPFQFRTDFMNGFEGYDFIGRKLDYE